MLNKRLNLARSRLYSGLTVSTINIAHPLSKVHVVLNGLYAYALPIGVTLCPKISISLSTDITSGYIHSLAHLIANFLMS